MADEFDIAAVAKARQRQRFAGERNAADMHLAQRQRMGRAKALGESSAQLYDDFVGRLGSDSRKWPPAARAEFKRQDSSIVQSLSTPEDWDDDTFINAVNRVAHGAGRDIVAENESVYDDEVFFAEMDEHRARAAGVKPQRPDPSPLKPDKQAERAPLEPRQPPVVKPARLHDRDIQRIAQERQGLLMMKAIFAPLLKNADEMPSIDNREPTNEPSETVDLPEESGMRTR